MATRWWPVACSSFIAECVLRSAPDFERCFLDLALADIRDASTVVSLPGASAIWSNANCWILQTCGRNDARRQRRDARPNAKAGLGAW